MQTVNVKKDKLMKILLDNRKKHRSAFEKACDDYRVALVGILDDKLRDAKSGKRVEHTISLYMPADQTKDYDRAINMLEMSVDKIINLQEHEFAQLVQDEWTWKHQFSASNSLLASTAMTYRGK